MISKRVVVLAIMALVAVIASQPAMAGVGGCRIPGVGGCGPGGGQLSSYAPEVRTPSLLDNLSGALPADVIAFLRTMFDRKADGTVIEQPSTITSQGLGGCIGVGGCKL
jgi:hypothetical protein